MRLVPFLRVTLVSDLPPDDVARRLVGMISRQAPGWFEQPAEPFDGIVRDREFKIVRNLGTRLGLPLGNSWRPVVVGRIVADGHGSQVLVTMRLPLPVLPFTLLWFASALTATVLMVWQGLTSAAPASSVLTGIALGGGLLGYGYALLSVAFWPEVAKARTLLREGFVGRETTSTVKN